MDRRRQQLHGESADERLGRLIDMDRKARDQPTQVPEVNESALWFNAWFWFNTWFWGGFLHDLTAWHQNTKVS